MIRSHSRLAVRFLIAACCSIQSGFAQDVAVHENIPYKSGSGVSDYERERCMLDIYVPDGVGNYPVIVWFHGGGLTAGDKAGGGQAEIVTGLAARGIGVVSVNYRLSPRARYPAYVEDAAAAVAWTLDNIGAYGGNVNSVFVSGHSAGGYLAAMVGVDEQYLRAAGHGLSELAGLVPISGQMVTHATVREERGLPANRPIVDAAAPVNHVSPEAPPFLSMAGSEDEPARAEENRYFAAAMRAAGHRDATYLEFEGRTHGSIVMRIPEEDDPVAAAIVDFVGRLAD